MYLQCELRKSVHLSWKCIEGRQEVCRVSCATPVCSLHLTLKITHDFIPHTTDRHQQTETNIIICELDTEPVELDKRVFIVKSYFLDSLSEQSRRFTSTFVRVFGSVEIGHSHSLNAKHFRLWFSRNFFHGLSWSSIRRSVRFTEAQHLDLTTVNRMFWAGEVFGLQPSENLRYSVV